MVIGGWRLVPPYGLDGTGADPGRIEEHAKGAAGLLWKSWFARFGRLKLAIGAESRSTAGLESLAGLRGLAGLSDPAKREPA